MLLAGLEHRENSWKHLCALPIGRWSIYVAKLLIASGLVALSTVVLATGVGIEGLLLHTLRPDLGLTLPIPWSTIFGRSVVYCAAALLLVAVQTWVAIAWRSFTIAIGMGIVGTVAGLVLSISPRAASFASVCPWSIPFTAMPRTVANISPQIQLTALLVGVVGGLVISMLGCWVTSRGDVQ